jgi:hypothetical protein
MWVELFEHHLAQEVVNSHVVDLEDLCYPLGCLNASKHWRTYNLDVDLFEIVFLS